MTPACIATDAAPPRRRWSDTATMALLIAAMATGALITTLLRPTPTPCQQDARP